MERRSFLALLASAPIAALAQWAKMLEPPRLAWNPKALAMAMEPLMSIEEFTERYIQPAVEHSVRESERR